MVNLTSSIKNQAVLTSEENLFHSLLNANSSHKATQLVTQSLKQLQC